MCVFHLILDTVKWLVSAAGHLHPTGVPNHPAQHFSETGVMCM